MKLKPYLVETLFLILTLLLSVAGFWELYTSDGADPTGLHHLHVLTSFGWLGFLLFQLRLVASARVALHRKVGRWILGAAPLLVASLMLLAVHSASKGVASGAGDPLIVQNVFVTLEIGVVLILAFVFLRRPLVHGAFLLSSALFFMGIALFFALLSFAPPFRIEGPETFYRFGTAAATAQGTLLVAAAILFFNNRRNGGPYLLIGFFVLFNALTQTLLERFGGADLLTQFVGSWNPYAAFALTFALMLGLLLSIGVRRPQRPASPPPARGSRPVGTRPVKDLNVSSAGKA